MKLAGLLLFAAALWQPAFDNVAGRYGLVHSFPNGGPTASQPTKKYIIETTGSGAGWIDYDNDGYLDAILLSGNGGTSRLYRNEGGRRFRDVSTETGFSTSGWAQGMCAGDADNDGFTDFVITHWGSSTLFHNQSGRRFRRIELPTGPNRYNTGCALLDHDRDGDLDLVIANYLRFDFSSVPLPGANPYCFYRNVAVNCGPRGLDFDHNILLRNDGALKFTDVSVASGMAAPHRNYALGVLTGDFDGDGWTDIFIACDQTPSLLYINQRDGTFSEEGLLRGAALDEHGKSLSGMGAAAADSDGDGWLDIFRTNFSDEYSTLYRNRGQGEFEDATVAAGLSVNTHYVGWGTGFLDFDNDGWKDLLLVNGHVFPEADRLPGPVRFRQRAILYRNQGKGRFTDASAAAGPAIAETHVARGAAFGDFDNDGVIDVLVNNQNEAPSLLRLKQPSPGHWIILKLEGTASNRSALGARVRVTANSRTQIDEVRSGGSYLSQNDLRLHFGLGTSSSADRIEILWPSGARQVIENVRGGRVVVVAEPARAATNSPPGRL